ncbi:MAG: phage protein GemA/Gp16 family protein [bacterium]
MPIGRKKKALVHIAKEDLHLDEESYRQILKGVAGVESSAQLTEEGFEKVMRRFQEMGFKGLLPDPYQPVPKGRLIPADSPLGKETITSSQLGFVSYLLQKLGWDEGHYRAFCRRIIKRDEPLTKRDGQKMIIGLLAVLRQRTRPHPPLPHRWGGKEGGGRRPS